MLKLAIQRWRTILSLLIVVPLGLLSKFYKDAAHEWLNDYAGGIFYEILWNVAHKLVDKFDLIVFVSEAVRSTDLNIQGMMKRCKPKWDEEQQRYLENGQCRKAGLNKAIQDASWYSLKQKTKVLAERYGCMIHEINPRQTSQECSACGYISPTNRDKEKFLCESCGYAADADYQAAVNILNRGPTPLSMTIAPADKFQHQTVNRGRYHHNHLR